MSKALPRAKSQTFAPHIQSPLAHCPQCTHNRFRLQWHTRRFSDCSGSATDHHEDASGKRAGNLTNQRRVASQSESRTREPNRHSRGNKKAAFSLNRPDALWLFKEQQLVRKRHSELSTSQARIHRANWLAWLGKYRLEAHPTQSTALKYTQPR